MTHVSTALEKIERAGLKLKPKKCKFGCREINFLGYHISQNGIKPDEEKLELIEKVERPKNIKELQSFLGMTNYFNKFLQGYSEIISPLNSLLSKNKEVLWTEHQTITFKTIKERLKGVPMLLLPKIHGRMVLKTDASSKALGTCLSQMVNKSEHIISFASRKLSEREQKYCATDRELLAIVWALKKFRIYLLGRRFQLLTDQNPLIYYSTFRDSHNRRARWLMLLNEYDFDIAHIKGPENTAADFLSRSENSIYFASDLDIKAKQLKDPFIIETIKNMEAGAHGKNIDHGKWDCLSKEKNRFLIDHGALYYCDEKSKRLVVPSSVINDLISNVHARDTCHAGRRKTLQSIKQNFYWPGMSKDITD